MYEWFHGAPVATPSLSRVLEHLIVHVAFLFSSNTTELLLGAGEVFGAGPSDETTRTALEAIQLAQQAQQGERQRMAQLKAAKKAAFDSEYDTGTIRSPSSSSLIFFSPPKLPNISSDAGAVCSFSVSLLLLLPSPFLISRCCH